MSTLQAFGIGLYMAGHGTSKVSGTGLVGPAMMIVGGILIIVGALV